MSRSAKLGQWVQSPSRNPCHLANGSALSCEPQRLRGSLETPCFNARLYQRSIGTRCLQPAQGVDREHRRPALRRGPAGRTQGDLRKPAGVRRGLGLDPFLSARERPHDPWKRSIAAPRFSAGVKTHGHASRVLKSRCRQFDSGLGHHECVGGLRHAGPCASRHPHSPLDEPTAPIASPPGCTTQDARRRRPFSRKEAPFHLNGLRRRMSHMRVRTLMMRRIGDAGKREGAARRLIDTPTGRGVA